MALEAKFLISDTLANHPKRPRKYENCVGGERLFSIFSSVFSNIEKKTNQELNFTHCDPL